MSEHDPPFELSAKNLQVKKAVPHKKKNPLRIQTTKPKNSVKLRPTKIPNHFTWALVLTIFCFFVIGPCWALYKTFEVRRMIADKDFDGAHRLSSRISSTLLISTIIGVFAWVCFLFASAGILITGVLLKNKFI
ncbi:unnamed protein product [Adineta ricciae]|uniref:Uncharacterized protein n=1 Tax=Adineta ricciae TaxID=249248 RepID=A0A815FDC9_ADIRI|nr:unnamed protein product [Adineta ricciae]CAF1323752.1 unnamed protein product [Adineta ricciae]